MNRHRIDKFGIRGASAIVFTETLPSKLDVVRVQWREGGRLRTRSFPLSAGAKREARAFAQGTVERLQRIGTATVERITVAQLFDRYFAHRSPQWREKTRVTTRARWHCFQNLVGPNKMADAVSADVLDEIRGELLERYAANQVVQIIALAKAVWRLGSSRGWVLANKLAQYDNRLAKDAAPLDVPEYAPDEVAAILAQFDRKKAREWRMWVAVTLACIHGPRQRALFGLEWRDVDLTARTIRWRPELDKRGKDRTHPLPRASFRALCVALKWRTRIGYTGPFVLPPVQHGGVVRFGDRVSRDGHGYTYQAAVGMLHGACRAAGVPVVKHRAFHGFRRYAAKTVYILTGDLKAAGDWIGDNDIRTLTRSYLKNRPEEQLAIARQLALPAKKESAPVTERQPERGRAA